MALKAIPLKPSKGKKPIGEGRNLPAPIAREVPASCVCLSVCLHSPREGVVPVPEAGDGAAEQHLLGRGISGLPREGSSGSCFRGVISAPRLGGTLAL